MTEPAPYGGPEGSSSRGPYPEGPTASPPYPRRVLVVYGTREVNTERVAEALARGLQQVGGIEVDCVPIEEFPVNCAGLYDLIAIGGPTEWHSGSGPVRRFLGALEGRDLRGMRGFAFDTRYPGPRSGGAAKVIQRRLEQLGFGILMPSSSGFVTRGQDPGGEGTLAAHAEERFELVGQELGASLLQ